MLRGDRKTFGVTAAAILIGFLPSLSIACSGRDLFKVSVTEPEKDFSGLTVSQGLAGHVWFWEGDFQPGAASGTIQPVERWIVVFPPVDSSQLTEGSQPGFFSEVQSLAVDSVRSDSTGFYQIDLPPGGFAVFVREGLEFYFNGTNSVSIQPDSVSRLHINIDYLAAW